MKVAYIDTSCLAAVLFGEPGADAIAKQLDQIETLVSSNLLEAELLASLKREGLPLESADEVLGGLHWLVPAKPLSPELRRILELDVSRGADLWHLACALAEFPRPEEVAFATLDGRQWLLAHSLGFQMLPSKLPSA